MPSPAELMQAALDAERAGITAERLKISEERLGLVEALREADARQRPNWWSKWLEPGPLLAVSAMFGGFFITYQNDKAGMLNTIADVRSVALSRGAEQANALTSLAGEMHATSKAAEERATKYLPIIEHNSASLEAQKFINDQVNDRIANLVKSVQDLRASVDALRDLSQRNREDIMVDKARREGRNIPGRGTHAPTPDDDTTAGK